MPQRENLMRLGPSLAGLVCYGIFAALRSFNPQCYAGLLWLADAMPQTPLPFSDLRAIMQSAYCARQGVDVYLPNACMGGGVYNYSPFLLSVLFFAPGLAGQMAAGICVGLIFLMALSLLPPAKSRNELIYRISVICSPTVIFALERANLDVAIFLLVLLAVLLILTQHWPAALGYLLFLFGAACKFYPAVLLALLLRERPRHVLAAVACLLAAGCVYALLFGDGSLTALRTLPIGLPYNGIFGAEDLPFGLVLLHFMPVDSLTPNAMQYLTSIQHRNAVACIELVTRLAVFSGLLAGYLSMPSYRDQYAAIPPARLLFLLAGALVMVFCFYVTQNIPYRAIFLLMTLPGSWELAARAPAASRRTIQMLLGAILLLLWEDALRQRSWDAAKAFLSRAAAFHLEFILWLGWEVLWWWVIIQFTALIFCFLRAALAKFSITPVRAPLAGVP